MGQKNRSILIYFSLFSPKENREKWILEYPFFLFSKMRGKKGYPPSAAANDRLHLHSLLGNLLSPHVQWQHEEKKHADAPQFFLHVVQGLLADDFN